MLQIEQDTQPVNTWPAGLPTDAVQPWEEVDAEGYVIPASRDYFGVDGSGKAGSVINAASEFAPGIERVRDSVAGVVENGEAVTISSGTADAGGIGWAYYRLTMGGVQPGVICCDVNRLASDGGTASEYYIGLADYGRSRWEWLGPFADSNVRLSTNTEVIEGADYLSDLGNMFICIVAHDGALIDVVGVAANPVDANDAFAPPAPSGLTLTPVAGGLELVWNGVVAGDLAGYQIYYDTKWFYYGDAPGVQKVEVLEETTRYLLDGLSDAKHVRIRVSAMDISGNESELSDLVFEQPLAGVAPELALTTSAASGSLSEVITLSATGAGFYDWDVDGDGIFDITSDSFGSAAVDTTRMGLIRPSVRGKSSGHTMIACSSVSVIVTSNSRPVASAIATPQSGDAPLAVTFAGTAEDIEDDASALTYAWDFNGDGAYEPGTDTLTPSPHTYVTPGLFNAKFRVADSDGAWDVDTVTVVAYGVDPANELPTADLAIAPGYGDAGDSFTLDASGSSDPDGTVVNYEWDFNGNGAFDAYGISAIIPNTYNDHGVFTALVRVTDNAGGQDTATAEVRVNEVFDLDHPWGNFGHDNRNTRRSPYIGAQTNNLKWSCTTGDDLVSSPTISSDGTVYVGSYDFKLYAIKPNGSLKWDSGTTIGSFVESSPAIGADGTVYVGSYDNKLYALYPDGTEKWSYATGGIVSSSPVIGSDGTVYVGSWDNKLYALNPDGSLKWDSGTILGDVVHSSPAIGSDGTVYVGAGWDNKLYAFNPDGSLKWDSGPTIGSLVISSPAIGSDGTVYVGSVDNKLYAFNSEGSLKWDSGTTMGDSISSSPAIGANGTVYVGCTDNKLYAFNPDGSLKWSYTTGDDVFSSPAIGADGTIYVGSLDSKLYAFNPDGSLKWDSGTTIESAVYSSPAIGEDGTVYVGSDDNKLYAFGVGNSPPTADLTATPPECNKGETIRYDASGSTDIQGPIADYEWDFDNDGTYNETGDEADNQGNAAVLQTYPNAGHNTVTVRVTDSDGATDIASVTTTVHGWANPLVVDPIGIVGEYTSICVVNGNPAISYYDQTNNDLKYVRAADADGSIWGTPQALDTAGVVGLYTSLVVVDGNPAISYFDNTLDDLKYVRATNADGSTWGTPLTVDSANQVGEYTCLCVVDGNPAISYFDSTNDDLKFVQATSADGSSWGTPLTPDATGDVGSYTSLCVVDGNPAISYCDNDSDNLKYVRALDTAGSTWDVALTVDSIGGVNHYTSLCMVGGNPAISYYEWINGDLKYVRAMDADGSSWGTPQTLNSTGYVGQYPSLCVVGSTPAISYFDSTNSQLKYVRAMDVDGSNWGKPQTIDSAGFVGVYTSLCVVDGNPAISYFDDTNNDLKFLRLY